MLVPQVLSNNQLARAPALGGMAELTKLSLSHNQLSSLPSLREAWQLKELRLSHNRICRLPADRLSVLGEFTLSWRFVARLSSGHSESGVLSHLGLCRAAADT